MRSIRNVWWLAIGLGLQTLVYGTTRTWDGKVDTLYTNGMNWVGNVAPAHSDYSDNILFMENFPSNKTPYLNTGRSINTVVFSNSVGWVFGGGATLVFRQMNSSGAGTNTFSAYTKSTYANGFNVQTNNVLFLSGGFYLDGANTLKLDGGGMLYVPNAIDGWSSARRLRIVNGTLRTNTSAPCISHGAVIIASKTAFVQLKATQAVAAGRIGTFILDETGIGLRAVDLGGGYAQVEVIPPPSGTVLYIQ